MNLHGTNTALSIVGSVPLTFITILFNLIAVAWWLPLPLCTTLDVSFALLGLVFSHCFACGSAKKMPPIDLRIYFYFSIIQFWALLWIDLHLLERQVGGFGLGTTTLDRYIDSMTLKLDGIWQIWWLIAIISYEERPKKRRRWQFRDIFFYIWFEMID